MNPFHVYMNRFIKPRNHKGQCIETREYISDEEMNSPTTNIT